MPPTITSPVEEDAMANICTCCVEITGQVDELRKGIQSQDTGLIELFPWFSMESWLETPLDNISVDENNLSLVFSCDVAPPYGGLHALSKAYPDCTIKVQYEEILCEVFGFLTYSGAVLVEDKILTTEEFLRENDSEFQVLVAKIEESTYDKFLGSFMDLLDGTADRWFSCIVEKLILNQLKNIDLPLLLNHKWADHKNQDEFEKRLKGE